jgi:SAM-dependent methyltransferase
MTPAQRRALLRAALDTGATGGPPLWADLGCGSGAFTLALADLLGGRATVHAVDRDATALRRLASFAGAHAAEVIVHEADFTEPLKLPSLDGVLMANALHFVARRRQQGLLERLREMLRPGGSLVVVEYDLSRGNPWVPHPVPAERWPALARGAGLQAARVAAHVPSSYWGRVYAARCRRAHEGDAGTEP